MMRIVVITPPSFVTGEAETILRLLDGGIDRVHLRKPDAQEPDMRRLIESLPEKCYPRLSLHDQHRLAVEYRLGGVHLNARNPLRPKGFSGLVSRSCHSLDELQACAATTDYRFLSPIFDSISKSGYRSAFEEETLRRAAERGVIDARTFALGGVEPERLPLLHDLGFGGAALLGCIWRDTSEEGLRQTLYQIRKYKAIEKEK